MSNAIKILRDEHQFILKALDVARKMCKNILNNGNWESEDFFKLVDFIRNYADRYHHGKEELILFKLMGEDLGSNITEGPIKGMLIEHDLGRMYIQRLEEALNGYKQGNEDARLDIIANTIAYTHLLQHHIKMEDNTLYPFAEKNLNPQTLEKLEGEVVKLEQSPESNKIREKYLNLLYTLRRKYE